MSSPPPPASPLDTLFLQNLMSRMQLNPPLLHTNSHLTEPVDDAFIRELAAALAAADPASGDDGLDDLSDGDDNSDDAGGEGGSSDPAAKRRRLVAREEDRLEKEIVKIVSSGDWEDKLKPNSGQSVTVGEHSICVGYHDDNSGVYRIWEWHGHIMLFDDEDGYSAEYIYGNYFERVVKTGRKDSNAQKGKEKEKESNGSSGLLDLIDRGVSKSAAGNGNGNAARVVHRPMSATAAPCPKASTS